MKSERVKQVRIGANLTQTEFGKRLGQGKDFIFNIEKDKVPLKDVFAEHLCDVFSVNREWLETGEGEAYYVKEESETINEALRVMKTLPIEWQEYVLRQMKDLLELQNKTEQ